MQRGGYPLEKDDLTIAEWKVLGIIAEERDSVRLPGAVK